MPTDLLAASSLPPVDLLAGMPTQPGQAQVAPSYWQQLQQDAGNEWNTAKGDAQAVASGLVGGLGGIATGGQQIANAGIKALNLIPGNNLPVDTSNYQNALPMPANPTTAQTLLSGAASFLPYAAGGEAALPEKLLGSPLLAKGVVGLGSTGAAYNQTMTPNPTLGGDLRGAAANIAMGAPGMALHGMFSSLGNNLPPEQLAANLAAAGDTNTGLGAVIGSPALQFGQKVAMNVPFSGGQGIKAKIADQVTSQGQQLVDGLSGGVAPQDVGNSLQQALKLQLANLQTTKTQNYTNLNNLAQQSGLQVGRDNMKSAANQALQEINSSDELKRTMPPNFLADIQSYASPEKTVTSTDPIVGTQSTTIPANYSLQDSNIFRSLLGDKANDAYMSGNNYMGGIYNKMKTALTSDIGDAIDNSANPAIKSEYQNAQNFYAQNIAPWEDPAVAKYAKFGGDPDTLISAFVKPGATNDRGNLVSSLINKLPPEQQSLPGYAYLARAYVPDPVTGAPTFSPQKFSQLYNNIGVNTKTALFGDTTSPMRQQLEQYNNLVGMNKSVLNTDTAKNQHTNMMWEAIAASIAEHHYGLPATAKVAAGLAGGSAVANRLLTSPVVRAAVARRLQNPVPYSPGTLNTMTGGLGLTPAFINNQQGQ